MDYSKALFDLIKSKKELRDDGWVSLSLGEIADVWNRKNVAKEDARLMPLTTARELRIKSLEHNFLQDTHSVLEKFQSEKLIDFKYTIEHPIVGKDYKKVGLSSIFALSTLEDELFLETKKNFDKYLLFTDDKDISKENKTKSANRFKLHKTYRQVYVNDYTISIPQEGGQNKMFLDFVMGSPNTYTYSNKLPDHINLGGKSFIKILVALGFTGEIRRAFFKDVGKSHLLYRGNAFTRQELEKEGIDVKEFIQELELKHSKNAKKSIANRTI